MFYGALASLQVDTHRPFAYVLVQRDENTEDDFSFTVAGGGGAGATTITTEFEYDSYYVGVGSTGALSDQLTYAVEVVYESGENLSNSFDVDPGTGNLIPVPQTEDDIEAWAVDVRLDYLLADARQTRLSGEVILATGDDDRGHTSNTFDGNVTGTDDRSFNAFGLLNTGVAFSPPVSNLAMARVGFSTFPWPDVPALRRLQVGADVFVFGKFESDAPIDEPTTADRYLGVEPDLFINWRLSSDVTLALRYGVFFPGEAIVNDEDERHFFFTGLTFAF
jgi:hypothetical protein